MLKVVKDKQKIIRIVLDKNTCVIVFSLAETHTSNDHKIQKRNEEYKEIDPTT